LSEGEITLRRRLFSALMLVPLLGLVMMSTGSNASASPATHTASRQARALAAARAALSHLKIGKPVNQRVPGQHLVRTKGLTQFDSFNWSGYADDNTSANTYSKVTGKWNVPAITCNPDEDMLAAFWVGIDGFTSGTVEQDGTLAQCFQGTITYYTWWEMYPTNDIQVVGTTVAPGDSIAASVTKTGTSYKLVVTDSTTAGNNVSTTQTCAAATCTDTSAEWIAEAPSGPRGEYPLPDFHTWSLTAATVKSGTTTGKISTFPDDEITMIDGTQTYNLATPGALNAAGNAFKVTWNASY
jgi:hypothetical protein